MLSARTVSCQLLCVLALLLSAAPVRAESTAEERSDASPAPIRIDEAYLKLDARYDNSDGGDLERIQGAVRAGLTVALYDAVDVAGFLCTGSKFSSRWNDLRNLSDPGEDKPFDISLRQLYLMKKFGRCRFQLGAIPPVKNLVSSTGLSDEGWIDGARFEIETGLNGVLEFVAGSITDLEKPGVFSRDFDFNYAEIELSQRIAGSIIAEMSVEYFDDETYLRGELRTELQPFADRSVELAAEGMANLDDTGHAVGLGAEADLLHWLTGKYKNRITLKLLYTYLHPEIGARGKLIEDFSTLGDSLSVQLHGNLYKRYGLKWFSKTIVAEDPRFYIGISSALAK